MKIGAILLAAGLSRRMGKRNKLLMHFQGQPMIHVVLAQIPIDRLAQFILVTGHEHNSISNSVARQDILISHNNDYKQGMSTSIKAGMLALEAHALDAVLICLADMPSLTTSDYLYIVENYLRWSPKILVPEWNKQAGHPVVFSKDYFGKLRELPSRDQGARSIIKSAPVEDVRRLAMPNDHCLLDIDSIHDLG